MNNAFDVCVLKLMAYYKFEGELDGGVHPRVEMLKEFLSKNVPEEELVSFYDKITRHCRFFPNKVDLIEMLPDNKPYKKEEITMGQIENKFVELNSIPKEPRIGMTYKKAWDNRHDISANDMLKDYGLDIFRRAWTRDGREMTDEQYRKFTAELKRRAVG